MLHSVFYFVLNMSITAALIVTVLLIVRLLFGRWIQRTFIYYMWGIVLFRLLMPVSVSNRFSLINFINGRITKPVAIPKTSEAMLNISTLNSVQAANRYFPLEYKSSMMESVFVLSGLVWICGAAIFVTASVLIYIITVSQLRKSLIVREGDILGRCKSMLNIKGKIELFESDFVTSPVVTGIINPNIIVPKGISEEALEYALLHELVHIKRRDSLLKLVSVFAACIHWFNPFAWLFLYISGQDMELACDEKVLKTISKDKRKSYAKALISQAAKQSTVFTAFGGSAVKHRIMNIAAYKHISLAMAAVTGIICTVIAVLLITNPVL